MNSNIRIANWLKKPVLPWANWLLYQSLVKAKLNVLEMAIADALRFLKKKYAKGFFSRKKIPWYLVLGPENAGKTSLLAMSGLNLVSTDNKPPHHVAPTAYCDFWFGNNNLFIDTSGSVMLSTNPENDVTYLWKKFIKMLHKKRHYGAVNGMIICIDIIDFQKKSFEQRQLQIDIFCHHIQALKKQIQALPIYIIFTKCDLIQGFTAFFRHLMREDRHQICGITLPAIAQQNFPNYLEKQFNKFLLHLNQQLLHQLHQEKNIEQRGIIKDFPLQIESQKRTITQLAAQLHSSKTAVTGIYFTSSLQEGAQTDSLIHSLHAFNLPISLNVTDQLPERNTYFIREAFKKIISNKTQFQKINFKERFLSSGFWETPYFSIYLSILSLLVVSFIGFSYYSNRQAITHIENTFEKFHASANPINDQKSILSALNLLQQASNQAEKYINPVSSLIFHHANVLQTNVKILYDHTLNTQFSSLLKNSLELQLKNTTNTQPRFLFDTLKVYLMLGDSTHLDVNFVATWFKKYWQEIIPNDKVKQHELQAHLNNWLRSGASTFKSDSNIIKDTRKNLSSYPLSELVYLNLQEKYADTLYSPSNFNIIYEQDIPKLSNNITAGDDWVLDLKLPKNLAQPVKKQLTDNVQHVYAQRYADFWQAKLLEIEVPHFKNLKKASAFVKTLNTNQSPLLAAIQSIEQNLKPIATLNEGETALAKLAETRAVVINFNQTNHLINELVLYLDKLANATDSGQAALNAAQERMKNENKDIIAQLFLGSKSQPAPLSAWLNELANNTWESVLKTGQNHLNLLWITSVWPEYNQSIKNRYPVFKNSKAEISLEKFTDFFGPSGVMDTFFQHNLSAFIDSSQLYWKWKDLDGRRLEVPQGTLEMFNRAAIIRKMYFPDNQKTPFLKLTLVPISEQLSSENYVLNLGGQTIDYAHDFKQNRTIQWPFTGNKSDTASFSLLQPKGVEKVFFQATGQWQLFRLFSQGKITMIQNAKIYELMFSADGKQVPYQLITDSPVNPFIANFLAQFRCPERL